MDLTSLILFAQQKNVGPKPDEVAGIMAGMGAFIVVYLCVVAAVVIISIGLLLWYSMTASKALAACSEKNREWSPGMAYLVFLVFVPFIGGILLLVMYILIALKVAGSLEKEFASRGLKADGDFGKLLGILMVVPCIGFICMILWIMKIKGYTAQLAGGGGGGKKSRDDDDDD